MVGRRQIRIDMDGITPGLFMKVGPFLGSTGMLEFMMDPSKVHTVKAYETDQPKSMGKKL